MLHTFSHFVFARRLNKRFLCSCLDVSHSVWVLNYCHFSLYAESFFVASVVNSHARVFISSRYLIFLFFFHSRSLSISFDFRAYKALLVVLFQIKYIIQFFQFTFRYSFLWNFGCRTQMYLLVAFVTWFASFNSVTHFKLWLARQCVCANLYSKSFKSSYY